MKMYSDTLVDIAIDEISKTILIAGQGLARHNAQASQALLGCGRAINKKRADIKANVLERYEP